MMLSQVPGPRGVPGLKVRILRGLRASIWQGNHEGGAGSSWRSGGTVLVRLAFATTLALSLLALLWVLTAVDSNALHNAASSTPLERSSRLDRAPALQQLLEPQVEATGQSGNGTSARVNSSPASATWVDFFPSGWTNQAILDSGVTVSDPAGLRPETAEYRTSTNGGGEWSAWTGFNLTAAAVDPATVALVVSNLSFPDSQLQNRIQFRIRNEADMLNTSEPYALAVDTVSPNPPFNLQASPDGWTNVNLFSETWSNPDDLSGVVGVFYRLNQRPSHATDGIFVPVTNALTDLQVPGEGAHTIYIWLMDAAGNVDHEKRNVDVNAFQYDSGDPTVSVELEGPMGLNGWYTGTVAAALNPQDSLSGVAQWAWTLDETTSGSTSPVVIDGDLLHQLVITATDYAGNVAAPATTTIPVDTGLPELTYAITGALPSLSGWYTAPITVTFSLTDATSGPDTVTWQVDDQPAEMGLELWLGETGEHSLRFYASDLAGNRSPESVLSLPVDTDPPSTTLSIEPPIAPSGYYTAPVTLQFEATDVLDAQQPGQDGGSGVAHTWMQLDQGPWEPAATFQIGEDGFYLLSYYSEDIAGNVEVTQSQTISLDAMAPAAAIAPLVEPAGWSASNEFALSWLNPPEVSGVAGAFVYIGEEPVEPEDASFYATSNGITGLAAPGEGDWPIWLWLQDVAGNADPAWATRAGSLQFDATPPEMMAEITGPEGNAGWYTGAINVSLTVSDTGSGPGPLRYRLDGGEWQESAAPVVMMTVDTPGKHVLEYQGQDVAGATAGPFRETLRLDADPPGSPIGLTIDPAAWTNTGQFTVTWRNPLDTSGVETAYLSTRQPEDARDGEAAPAAVGSSSLQAPAEGIYDLYVWLEDLAGNISEARAARLEGAVRYDSSPPTTTLTFSPEPSDAGWFRGDVAVFLHAEDALSGVKSTVWQLDDAPASMNDWLLVEGEGQHTLLVYSEDNAGNREQPQEIAVKIDTQAPVAHLRPMPSHSMSPELLVQWGGSDPASGEDASLPGSGLAGFDVQVKMAAGGTSDAWQPWLDNTLQTQATYEAQPGQVVSFRVRARDGAGNLSPWTDAAEVFVNPVENGDFSTLNWDGWQRNDGLGLSLIQETDLMPGVMLPAARLGSTTWQSCSFDGDLPNLLCQDVWSSIAQSVTVPSLDQVANPVLEVWYRVQTYDQMLSSDESWSRLCPELSGPPWVVDTFDITAQVQGSSRVDLLLRDGNPLPQLPPDDPLPPDVQIPFRDLGWQLATIDMAPYAGQTVRLEFASHNRLDKLFNTWTDVYGIRLRGEVRRVFLPMVGQARAPEPSEPQYCDPYTYLSDRQLESSDPGSRLPGMVPLGDLSEPSPRLKDGAKSMSQGPALGWLSGLNSSDVLLTDVP